MHCFTRGGDSLAAVRISRALADRDIGVGRFDFAGLGRRGALPLESVTADVADLKAAVLAMMAAGMPVSLLIGHSLGGIIAAEVAATAQGIRALETIGTPSTAKHLSRSLATEDDALASGSRVEIGGRSVKLGPCLVEDITLHTPPPKLNASSVPIPPSMPLRQHRLCRPYLQGRTTHQELRILRGRRPYADAALPHHICLRDNRRLGRTISSGRAEAAIPDGLRPKKDIRPLMASLRCRLAGLSDCRSRSRSRLSYDIIVRLGHAGLPGPGWPPRSGRKGTDRETAGR